LIHFAGSNMYCLVKWKRRRKRGFLLNGMTIAEVTSCQRKGYAVLRQKLGLVFVVIIAALVGLCAHGCYGTGGYETGTTAYYSSPAVEVVEVRTTTPVYRRSRPHRYGHSRHYSTGKHHRPAQTTRTRHRDTDRGHRTTRTPNRANRKK